MSLKSVCPTIATSRLQETRAFYDWLGFRVVCADPRSLQLAWAEDPDVFLREYNHHALASQVGGTFDFAYVEFALADYFATMISPRAGSSWKLQAK